MTYTEVTEKLSDVLATEFEVDRSAITPDAPLMQTLDLDSLDLVDIQITGHHLVVDLVDVVVIVEQNFGITIRQEDFVGRNTFADFSDLIYSKINESK